MKFIFIVFFGLVIYISFNSTVLNPYLFEGADKLKHLIAFFILSILFSFAFKDFAYKYYSLVLFAFLIEVGQFFTQRESSFYDFVFSVSGIMIFLLLQMISNFIQSILKRN